jgi:hypothetical protein
MSGNFLKTPFIDSMGGTLAQNDLSNLAAKGQAIPAEVVSVDGTGTIVVVNFLVQDPEEGFAKSGIQLPRVEMPVATDLYGIPPLKKGDTGYCLPADVYLGGVSGLGIGKANWGRPSNLSALAFHPLGNKKAAGRIFADKYFLSGPGGVHLLAETRGLDIILGGVAGEPRNVVQINTLVQAANDVEARAKGVPLNGLYYDSNGKVCYQYTVPT